ncbi:hypothetical protein D3C85_1139070 [compost metagenome]
MMLMLMLMLMLMVVVVVVGGRRAAAALAVTASSGGLVIPGRIVRLRLMGGRAGAGADRRDLVAAVAVVPMLGLAGVCPIYGLVDGLDGGCGVLMIAAGFAHGESLLSGSRRCGSAEN